MRILLFCLLIISSFSCQDKKTRVITNNVSESIVKSTLNDSNKITTIAQLISCLIYANKATDLDRIFLNLEAHKIDDSSKMKFATIISNVFYTIPKKDALNIYDSLNQHNKHFYL